MKLDQIYSDNTPLAQHYQAAYLSRYDQNPNHDSSQATLNLELSTLNLTDDLWFQTSQYNGCDPTFRVETTRCVGSSRLNTFAPSFIFDEIYLHDLLDNNKNPIIAFIDIDPPTTHTQVQPTELFLSFLQRAARIHNAIPKDRQTIDIVYALHKAVLTVIVPMHNKADESKALNKIKKALANSNINSNIIKNIDTTDIHGFTLEIDL